jgi:hypothetical protein
VSFPDQQVWDQDFFYAQGLSCIASDGLGHARVILRNIYDMGLSTIPWPPSNDAGLREVMAFTNVGYVLLLPFIVFGTIRKVRRAWPIGGGRGELMLLGQLSLALATAIIYFGDPRFRTPFDVFGLALAASLIADRIAPTPLGESAAADPGVRTEDTVQQNDERALRGTEAAGEVDSDDSRPAEADGGAAIGTDDGAAEEARWGESRRTGSDEVLGLIDPDVHEIAAVGPDTVEPERSDDLERPLGPQILSIREHAPDGGVGDEDPTGIARRGDEALEEVDASPIEER